MELLKLVTFGKNVIHLNIKINKTRNLVYITLGVIILLSTFLLRETVIHIIWFESPHKETKVLSLHFAHNVLKRSFLYPHVDQIY